MNLGVVVLVGLLALVEGLACYRAGQIAGHRKAESDRMRLEFEIQKRRVEEKIHGGARRLQDW